MIKNIDFEFKKRKKMLKLAEHKKTAPKSGGQDGSAGCLQDLAESLRQSLDFGHAQRTDGDAQAEVDLDGVDVLIDQRLMQPVADGVVRQRHRDEEAFVIRVKRQ